MNFLNRLKYYLIGVGLGILMVLAIFKDRKLTSWTPKNQVLKELSTKDLIIPDILTCSLNCSGYGTEKDIKLLLATASVEFSESDVSNHEKRKYLLEFDDSDIQEITLTIHEDFIAFNSLRSTIQSCNCK